MSSTSDALKKQETVFDKLAQILTSLINKQRASEKDKLLAEDQIKALIEDDESNAKKIEFGTEALNALLEAAKNATPSFDDDDLETIAVEPITTTSKAVAKLDSLPSLPKIITSESQTDF